MGLPRFGIALTLGVLMGACGPKLTVGTWACPTPDASQPAAIELPWTTGFESDFCDYTRSGGDCHVDPAATSRIVDSPVHSGRSAAAFSVTSDPTKDGTQARCYVQGTLPVDATYGAWFYLPAVAFNTRNWNLVHFEGGPRGNSHGLWDVTVANAVGGGLVVFLYDLLHATPRTPKVFQLVPIGKWFHLEIRLKRAKNATGEIALYQDGVLIDQAQGIVTDDTDVGTWFVGDLATGLTPSDYTLYVDDVTITAPR